MVQIVDPGRWEVAPFKGIDLPARAPSLGCLHIVGFFVVHAVGGILPPEGQPDQLVGLLGRRGRFPGLVPSELDVEESMHGHIIVLHNYCYIIYLKILRQFET